MLLASGDEVVRAATVRVGSAVNLAALRRVLTALKTRSSHPRPLGFG